MINTDFELIRELNNFIGTYPKSEISVSGVILYKEKVYETYYPCRIGNRPYSVSFREERNFGDGKCFINLYDDDMKDRPSVIQFTIDQSNFEIKNQTFYIRQNRGATIGRKIPGGEKEFKSLMIQNGFNNDDIIASGNTENPDYINIIQQLFSWLRIRLETKLQLEEKYRDIYQSRTEGKSLVITSLRAERDKKLREAAIKFHGSICKICAFDFEKTYGSCAEKYIEVHHMMPLSAFGKRETNPQTDLTVVCSNCHRMIHHKKNITLTVEELKTKLRR